MSSFTFANNNGLALFSFLLTSWNPSGSGSSDAIPTWTIGSRYKHANTKLRFDLENRFHFDSRVRWDLSKAERATSVVSIGRFPKHLVQ